MSTIDLDALLAPIPGANPSGADIGFEPVFDEIKEARRADDDYLNQGDWKAEIKVAEWGKVKSLASAVLSERSKDLQVACWLTEGLSNLHGFAGARDGFLLLDGLLRQYWDTLYPERDGDDIEERIGRLSWLDNNLSSTLRRLPMTGPAGDSKGYGYDRLLQAREVDNLARGNEDSAKQALRDGKINSEMWNAAVTGTPASFYEKLFADTAGALEAFKTLAKTIDELFSYDAPSVSQLQEVLTSVAKQAAKMAEEKGVQTSPAEAPASTGDEAADGSAPVAAVAVQQVQGGPPRSREEAIKRLREVAEYFREAEPHSPVAYLIEKAIRWSGMRLDSWLREVVRDDSTRDKLKDMLGYTEE
ncbi:MAG: type VI secretion system protein TssA [Moraxellaceae bacterium]|nr:type VI secretion system protein TssA [Moraxellaceae bacterium]